MSKKINYNELLGLNGAMSTPTTRLGLARIIKKARTDNRLARKVSIGYIVEDVSGDLREFARRDVRVWACIG